MKLTFAAFAFALSTSLAFADKGADLKPTLITPGKILVEEKFAATALGKPWTVAKGDWQIQDGQLLGKEKASDMHPAVLNLGQPNHDSAIRFSFKLDGAKGFNLSYNQAKGHLFRIAINEDGLVVTKDKDKKDAKSKADAMGKAAGKFEKGKWYTMLVEVKGTEVSIQTDNGVKLTAKHPAINVEKPNYRFVTRAATLALDDITVWEAAK